MTGKLFLPALFAAITAAVLGFGTYGVLAAGGPAGREEAIVEWRGQHDDSRIGHLYDLALHTASGERFEVSSTDAGLDLEPGLRVALEISEIGRSAQALEADGHRISIGNSPVALGVFVVLFAAVPLGLAVMAAARTGRPGLAALSAMAGFAAGALPVLLLF
jgi:hypothetical protein